MPKIISFVSFEFKENPKTNNLITPVCKYITHYPIKIVQEQKVYSTK